MKNIKKKIINSLLLTSVLFLSGCFWDSLLWLPSYTDLVCGFNADSDHCYQSTAIQNGDIKWCDKIKWEKFAKWWSNPPKDKCYLLISENTGDLSACNSIEWWNMSYTKEECILNTSKKHLNPSWCMQLSGSAKTDCINIVWPSLDIWEALEIDKQIEFLENELKKWSDPELEEQLKWLEKRKNDFIFVLPDTEREKYKDLSDPLNKEIRMDSYGWKIDKETKESLLALNKAALDRWESIPRSEYEAIRDMLKWKNDPNNDIEQMDDEKLLKPTIWEKFAKAKEYLKFWKANSTEREKKQDESLLFYQRMLERQAAIDKWYTERQQEFNKYYENAKNEWKDFVLWKINDELKKKAFWDIFDGSAIAWKTTVILWEALSVVQDHAKSSEFRWLVWAYNKWMEEELAKNNWNIEKAHEEVTKNLQTDPYRYEDYADWITFSKYGNLIENKECWPNNSNPLCLNKDIFFKAMKKSYKYQNK